MLIGAPNFKGGQDRFVELIRTELEASYDEVDLVRTQPASSPVSMPGRPDD